MPVVVTLFLLLITVGISAPAVGETTLTGRTAGGAYYRIIVPDGWMPTDGLVIWNHGIDLRPIDGVDDGRDMGPLAAWQLAQGYAVAASSYSLTGWAVFETHLDNSQMVQAFEAEYGTPDQIFVYGHSLGGIVTARDVEAGLIPNLVGALPTCGALGGSRIWDAAIDMRLLYDFLCGAVPGAAIPGGSGGLPFPPDPGWNETTLQAAVDACFGVVSPDPPSAEQSARLARFFDVSRIPEEFVLDVMRIGTFHLHDLVYDPRKLAGFEAFDNAHVDYGDAEINQGIERVVADQITRKRFLGSYTPSGKVGDEVKIVSIHTDKDGLVLVENLGEYASVVPPGQLTAGVVVEDDPSHCGFFEAETIASWEALRAWVGGAPKPTVQTLQDTCEALVAEGSAAGPCRYDPDFVIPELENRVRPRDVCVEDSTTLCLGAGDRFRASIEWRTLEGLEGVGKQATLQTDDTGSFWFFDSNNIEMVIKAIDGRQDNGRLWIFYGSLTDVAFELTVTDVKTGLVKVYSKALGDFASTGDTNAF